MSKKIIIDKTVFQGTSTEYLIEFARSHFLILSEVLLYECLTTDRDKDRLLDRFREVVLAGGKICPSRNEIIHAEAELLSPYGELIDSHKTFEIRETFRNNKKPYNLTTVEERYSKEIEFSRYIINSAKPFFDEVEQKNFELYEASRKVDTSKKEQLGRLESQGIFFNSQDMHLASTKIFKGITNKPHKFCLSDEWISWHFLRLFFIYLSDKFLIMHHDGSSPADEKIEHDIQDLTYVMLMSRAEVLLTNDNGLKCLSKAAFPDKDVFSNIKEIR